jgi:Domain of unknown function (DUF6431)
VPQTLPVARLASRRQAVGCSTSRLMPAWLARRRQPSARALGVNQLAFVEAVHGLGVRICRRDLHGIRPRVRPAHRRGVRCSGSTGVTGVTASGRRPPPRHRSLGPYSSEVRAETAFREDLRVLESKPPSHDELATQGRVQDGLAIATVWPCAMDVERYSAAGRGVAVPRRPSPRCGGATIFWSGYARFVRAGGRTWRLWIRRCRCRACSRSHALIPAFLLARRLDPAGVIGTALVRSVLGAGRRTVAGALEVPHTTARSRDMPLVPTNATSTRVSRLDRRPGCGPGPGRPGSSG